MQFRLFFALAAVVAMSAAMKGKVETTKTKDITSKGGNFDGTMAPVDYTKGDKIKGKQGEEIEKLSKDAGALKVDKSNIMGAIKKKAGDMKAAWATRKTTLKSEESTVINTKTTVTLDDNIIGKQAPEVEKDAVFKKDIEQKNSEDIMQRMSVGMMRKIQDLELLASTIGQFSSKFYPEIIRMVEKVKATQAFLAKEKSKAGSTTDTKKGAISEQVFNEKLLSEDRYQLELLIQAHNDLIASSKYGAEQINKLAPKIQSIMGETKTQYQTVVKSCLQPATTFLSELESERATVVTNVEQCSPKPEDDFPDFPDFETSFSAVGTSNSELKETMNEFETTETLLDSVKAEDPSKKNKVLTEARFKEDANIRKLQDDIAQINKDKYEVMRLSQEATAPFRGLRGSADAFLQLSGDDKVSKDKTPKAMKDDPNAKTTAITTKAKNNFAGGFGDNSKGKNNVADKILKSKGEVGDKTLTSSNTKTDTETNTADLSQSVDPFKKLAELNTKTYPRRPETEAKVNSATADLATAGGAPDITSAAAQYVKNKMVKKDKKPLSPADLLSVAKKQAKTEKVDEAISLTDERLVWLRDAMKEMAKYFIWAQAETKRGATVQTITDVKKYNTIIEKIQNDKSQTAIDSQKTMEAMIVEYKAVQENIDLITQRVRMAKQMLVASKGKITDVKSKFTLMGEQCKSIVAQVTKLSAEVKKKKCENADKLDASIAALKSKCTGKKVDATCGIDKFEKFMSDAGRFEEMMKGFRDLFSIYTSILGAFKDATGQ